MDSTEGVPLTAEEAMALAWQHLRPGDDIPLVMLANLRSYGFAVTPASNPQLHAARTADPGGLRERGEDTNELECWCGALPGQTHATDCDSGGLEYELGIIDSAVAMAGSAAAFAVWPRLRAALAPSPTAPYRCEDCGHPPAHHLGEQGCYCGCRERFALSEPGS